MFFSTSIILDAYWIRELIYIESTLPSKTWLKHNIIDYETVDNYFNDSIEGKTEKQDENDNKLLIDQSSGTELCKLLEVLQMLCTQAKQILDYEINLEQTLKQLLAIRKIQK